MKKEIKKIKCPKCNNYLKNNICEYCIWKGDAGPGLQLKNIIKIHNNTIEKKKEDEEYD